MSTLHTLIQTILFTCFFVLSAETAVAEVFECSEQPGSVTFTDTPCKAGEEVVRPGATPNPLLRKDATSVPAARNAADESARSAAAEKKSPHRGLATDIATMKAARDAMASSDHLASLSPRSHTFSRNY